MTLLKVHDLQQELAADFLQLIKKKITSPHDIDRKKDFIYLKGQEMGFCNDDIEVLLEDLMQEH